MTNTFKELEKKKAPIEEYVTAFEQNLICFGEFARTFQSWWGDEAVTSDTDRWEMQDRHHQSFLILHEINILLGERSDGNALQVQWKNLTLYNLRDAIAQLQPPVPENRTILDRCNELIRINEKKLKLEETIQTPELKLNEADRNIIGKFAKATLGFNSPGSNPFADMVTAAQLKNPKRYTVATYPDHLDKESQQALRFLNKVTRSELEQTISNDAAFHPDRDAHRFSCTLQINTEHPKWQALVLANPGLPHTVDSTTKLARIYIPSLVTACEFQSFGELMQWMQIHISPLLDSSPTNKTLEWLMIRLVSQTLPLILNDYVSMILSNLFETRSGASYSVTSTLDISKHGECSAKFSVETQQLSGVLAEGAFDDTHSKSSSVRSKTSSLSEEAERSRNTETLAFNIPIECVGTIDSEGSITGVNAQIPSEATSLRNNTQVHLTSCNNARVGFIGLTAILSTHFQELNVRFEDWVDNNDSLRLYKQDTDACFWAFLSVYLQKNPDDKSAIAKFLEKAVKEFGYKNATDISFNKLMTSCNNTLIGFIGLTAILSTHFKELNARFEDWVGKNGSLCPNKQDTDACFWAFLSVYLQKNPDDKSAIAKFLEKVVKEFGYKNATDISFNKLNPQGADQTKKKSTHPLPPCPQLPVFSETEATILENTVTGKEELKMAIAFVKDSQHSELFSPDELKFMQENGSAVMKTYEADISDFWSLSTRLSAFFFPSPQAQTRDKKLVDRIEVLRTMVTIHPALHDNIEAKKQLHISATKASEFVENPQNYLSWSATLIAPLKEFADSLVSLFSRVGTHEVKTSGFNPPLPTTGSSTTKTPIP